MNKLLLASLLVLPQFANALTTLPATVPASWTLRWVATVAGKTASLYASGTGSTCNLTVTGLGTLSNALSFGTGATQEDQRMFYNTVQAAKLAGKTIFVKYDEANSCNIVEFGVQ